MGLIVSAGLGFAAGFLGVHWGLEVLQCMAVVSLAAAGVAIGVIA